VRTPAHTGGRFKKPTKVAFVVQAPSTVTVALRPDNGPEQVAKVPDDNDARCYESAMDARGGTLELSGSGTIKLLAEDCPEGS